MKHSAGIGRVFLFRSEIIYCKYIVAYPQTFYEGHNSIEVSPLQYFEGYAATGGCPPTFAEGHATMGNCFLVFRTGEYYSSERRKSFHFYVPLHFIVL